ncbi:MAG: 50S ribosomal protein L1 [Dehalococcoidia bacterium]|jgi:large subunit ribosomal protein L1|nr:MAG: 50S ribosomal protein L1 [Dehalococcoidia bacterium]
MSKRGKKYQVAIEKIDPDKSYEPKAALALAKAIRYANFDETVELHLRMGLDPRHADQQVRGVALLPNGLGKQVRVLVFTGDPEGIRNAEEAGADFVGSDDLIQRIEGGWLDFDTAIATPDMMGKVGRLGRILGRRGLMPNPRSGTVVPPADLGRAIRDARKGRVEFRLDRTANIHVPIGKASFSDEALLENLATIVDAIVKAKPSGAKGQYVKSATITTTMGPGIPLDLAPTLALKAA